MLSGNRTYQRTIQEAVRQAFDIATGQNERRKPMTRLSSILTGPDKWCKKKSAADEGGNSVLPSSDLACSFCIGGAIRKMNSQWADECFVRHEVRKSIRKLFPDRAGMMHGVIEIEAFNDHPDTTFEDVQKVIADSGC